MEQVSPILVTGANGYVGSCLIPRLLEKGLPVRVFVRDRLRLAGRWWEPLVSIVEGDLLSPLDVQNALKGVTTAYYLVHNMSSGRGHPAREIESARNFASAAAQASIDHIIYLGGLADPAGDLGSHLRSRLLTGDALRAGKTPVTEFRAGLIIGSGSISFEMIRYVMEQLPVSFAHRWLLNRTQPIAIRNVLDYLLAALEVPSRGKVYEIGGETVLTYQEAMLSYARLRGLKRALHVLPWLPLGLMSAGVTLLSPVSFQIARSLIEGMRSESLVRDVLARNDFPQVQLLDYPAAVQLALGALEPDLVEFNWAPGQAMYRVKQQGFFLEAKRKLLDAPSEAVFAAVSALGGKDGWYTLNGLWKLHGWVDRRLGGPGLRGRRLDKPLEHGDVVDFSHVDRLIPGRFLRLRAELIAPGRGWMQWQVEPQPEGKTLLTQAAFFAPKGLPGFLYWYLFLPFHRLVFSQLIQAIARCASSIMIAH